MIALGETSSVPWVLFILTVLIFLALDLGVFHKKAHVVGFREAFMWTAIWFTVAICFGLFIAPHLNSSLSKATNRPVNPKGKDTCSKH